jgi:hypothetical protein
MIAPRLTGARLSRLRGGIVLGVLATGLLVSAQNAMAKGPPPKSEQLSAVSQYRESIPASEGPVLPGTGKIETKPLPAPITQQVEEQGGNDARVLTLIATKSSYGAPQRKLPQIGLAKRTPAQKAAPPQTKPQKIRTVDPGERGSATPTAVLSATGGIVGGSSGGRLLGLALVLGLLALAVGGVASLRSRS